MIDPIDPIKAIDIAAGQRRIIVEVLKKHLPDTAVWAYGSRVKWTSRPESDLDIVVFASPDQKERVSELKEALEESDLPFRVDLFVWDEVPERFRKNIEAEHAVLVERGERPWVTGSDSVIFEVASLIAEGLLVINDGYRAKNIELSTQGLPFARAGNIKDGFHFDDADRFPENNLHKVGIKTSQPGDVVFTSKGTVGRFAFVQKGIERFVYSPQLCFWRSNNSELILPRFLYYWMHGQEFFKQYSGVKGQTDMADYVSLRDQRAMSITLPRIDTQRAIAHILGSLDDKIELNRQMNGTLEKMAQAIFKSWFIDFDPVHAKAAGRDPGLPKEIADLFPDSFEHSELGAIPKGWEVKPIGDAVQCVGGSTPSTKKAELWDGGTTPFLTPKDMSLLISPVILDTDRHITDAGVEKISSKRLPAGTVILPSRAPIGYLAINEVPVSVNQGIIAMICSGDLSNHYVLFWTMANMEAIKGKAGGTTFAEISKKNFRPIPVLIPAPSILDAFMKQVEALFQQVVENVVSAESLARTRDTLLPKLISGELHVPDVDRLLEGVG